MFDTCTDSVEKIHKVFCRCFCLVLRITGQGFEACVLLFAFLATQCSKTKGFPQTIKTPLKKRVSYTSEEDLA